MNRRGFLRLIGLGAPAAAIAPFVPMPEFASGGAVGARWVPVEQPMSAHDLVSELCEIHDVVVYWDDKEQTVRISGFGEQA